MNWIAKSAGRATSMPADVMLLASLVLFMARVPLLFVRKFDQDEFEHIHAAWNIFRGQVMYVDFFEHHPPLIHYLLQLPLYMTGESLSTLFVSRMLMLPFVAGIFGLTYLIARSVCGSLVGALSVLLLSTMIMFWEKSLEVRPDVPMTFFWLLALHTLVASRHRGELAAYIRSGMCLALSMLFLPKCIFGYFALVIGICVLGRFKSQWPWRQLVMFHLGILIPTVVFVIWMLVRGSLYDFWCTTILLNAQMGADLRYPILVKYLTQSLIQNQLFWVAMIPGVLLLIGSRNVSADQKTILVFSLCGLLVGLWFNPAPNRQYYLLFIPIVSIGTSFFGVVVLAAVFRWRRIAGVLLGVLVVLFMLLPLRHLKDQYADRNTVQLEVIRYVLERTGPADAIFDCWTGLYLFRPNASYYHFLNWDLIEVLDNQALRDVLLEDLADESCRVVIRDRHHQFLHPDVRRVIAERFVPSPEFKYILFRDGDFDLNHDGRP